MTSNQPKSKEEPKEDIYFQNNSSDNIRETVENNIPDSSEIKDLKINGDKIYIKLTYDDTADIPNANISIEELAKSSYSALTDALLKNDKLNTFKVKFIGVGTIEMNRSDSEDQGSGPYFPLFKIDEKFRN